MAAQKGSDKIMENIIILIAFGFLKFLFSKNDENEKKRKPVPNTQGEKSFKNLQDKGRNLLTDWDNLVKEFQEKSYQVLDTGDEERSLDAGFEDIEKAYQNKDKSIIKSTNDFQFQDKIRNSEITDTPLDYNISFDKESLLQGIIMSEILDKPKALKR